jgi:transglutaminase-like putative cysteine protease
VTDDGTVRYRVVHRTTYRYASPMIDGYTVATLLPRDAPYQRVESAELDVRPAPDQRDDGVDTFGNNVQRFGIHHPHDELVVEARSVVTVDRRDDVGPDEPWEDVVGRLTSLRGDDALEIGPFLGRSIFVDLPLLGGRLAGIAGESFTPGRDVIAAAADLCDRIHRGFVFDPTFTELSTPLGEVLAGGRGVCQDFAHLATGCLRSIGLAARYVSGYIETDPVPGQERLVGADASHAWCSMWTPGAGWVDFDPTNGQLPARRHVTVAWGRDYADVTPVRGVVIGPATGQTLDVSVDVVAV